MSKVLHASNTTSIRDAGESSAHLWISHLPHAQQHSTRINIFTDIHRSASKWQKKKSSSVAKQPQQPASGDDSWCERDVALHFRPWETGPLVQLWSPAPLSESTWWTRIAQVQWATHPQFDKPALRGDGGIAPPVMVPELRLRLTTGLHRQRAAALIRIMQERLCPRRGFVNPAMVQLKKCLCIIVRGAICGGALF